MKGKLCIEVDFDDYWFDSKEDVKFFKEQDFETQRIMLYTRYIDHILPENLYVKFNSLEDETDTESNSR